MFKKIVLTLIMALSFQNTNAIIDQPGAVDITVKVADTIAKVLIFVARKTLGS